MICASRGAGSGRQGSRCDLSRLNRRRDNAGCVDNAENPACTTAVHRMPAEYRFCREWNPDRVSLHEGRVHSQAGRCDPAVILLDSIAVERPRF